MMAWIGTATIAVSSAGIAAGILYSCANETFGYLWSSADGGARECKTLPTADPNVKLAVDKVAMQAAGIDLSARSKTVLVYFRGTWSPPCRSQLRDISRAMSEFEQAGIAIHAITAEPGGDEALYERLDKHGVLEDTKDPTLILGLHSDPEHRLCIQPKDEIHLFNQQTGGEEGIQPYEVVEPAFAVVGTSGDVISWWSWRSITDDDNPPIMKLIPNKGRGIAMPLVAVRPITKDIVPSVCEYRQVKTTVDR